MVQLELAHLVLLEVTLPSVQQYAHLALLGHMHQRVDQRAALLALSDLNLQSLEINARSVRLAPTLLQLEHHA